MDKAKHCHWSVVGIILLVLAGCGNLESKPTPSGVTRANENTNQTWQVQYRVSGSVKSAIITILVPDGQEERTVSLPYTSPAYTFKRLGNAVISASNNDENSGELTTEIIVNGTPIKKATSQGGYGTCATANLLVGS